jgi:4-amino-4-deoxy-L-arabinose transferase-like glycosyltransferase
MATARLSRSRLLLGILTILVLGVAARGWLLARVVSISPDAARFHLPMAQEFMAGNGESATDSSIPPLYPALGGLLGRMTGGAESGCRTVSILASLLAILLSILLARRLFGDEVGLAAGALVALHPHLCKFGVDIGIDMLAASLLLLSTYLLVAYLAAMTLWRAILLGVSLALVSLARAEGPAYALAIGALMVFLPMEGRRWPSCRRLLHVGAFGALLLAICLPRMWWMHRRTGSWVLDERQITWTPRLLDFLRHGSFAHGQLFYWHRDGWRAVGDNLEDVFALLGPTMALLGIYGIHRRPADPESRLWRVPLILVPFSILLMLVAHRLSKRYLLPAGLLWQIWAALGLVLAVRLVAARFNRNWLVPVLTTVLLTVHFLPGAQSRLHENSRAERELGEWIRKSIGERQRLVGNSTVCSWYARGSLADWPSEGLDGEDPVAAVIAYAREHAAPLIVVDSRLKRTHPELHDALVATEHPELRVLHRVEGHTSLTLLKLVPE